MVLAAGGTGSLTFHQRYVEVVFRYIIEPVGGGAALHTTSGLASTSVLGVGYGGTSASSVAGVLDLETTPIAAGTYRIRLQAKGYLGAAFAARTISLTVLEVKK